MRLPTLADGTVDLEESVPLLRYAIDHGVNYIDSAHVYINGTSEVAVGQAIKGYDRSHLSLATKIHVDEEEAARAEVWQSKLEKSLKRLDTPYIDFLHVHGLRWEAYQYASRPGWALDVARKAQARGLVRHIVFSSHDTAENIMKLIDTGEFAGMLVQYNYLDRHNEAAIAYAAEKGMGVAIMGPVAGGRLAIPGGVVVDSEGALELKTPELALRFVWNNPHVSTALSGMSSMQQVVDNLALAGRVEKLDEGESRAIEALFIRNQKLADLYCTGCAYCMPCPNDINIPENFRYMNWYRVWGMEEQAREAYAKLSAQGTWTPWGGMVKGLKAEECQECGECEPKCPQNIPIRDQLKEAARILGKDTHPRP
jgi:predicted aldo/keto reductase-like oxidoreductase